MIGNSKQPPSEQYLRPDDAAGYLQSCGFPVARATLAKLRSIGDGPKFYRFGRMVIYSQNDLRDWATSKVRTSITATIKK